jgi:lincosamide nucleotidyltransferase A/C/D/E
MEIDAANASRIVGQLEAAGLVVWLDGGWGVDALLGRQTRPHQDLDLVIARDDLAAAQQALAPASFAHDPTAMPGLPARLALVDADGREVDLHPVIFDRHGCGWQDLGADAWGAYPAEELTATGVIAGRSVRCKTPTLEVRHRLGYPLTATDRPTDTILPCWPSGLVSPYLQASPTRLPAASLVVDRVRPGVVFRGWSVPERPATLAALLGPALVRRHDRTEWNPGMLRRVP